MVTGGVAAGGPLFVSYRQSDGKDLATELAWLLRAAGAPVWHDQTDLPPGDTEQRLDEALRSGLSGAVLLVTDDLGLSGVVRHVELPRLRELARDPDFVLAIANNVRKSDGTLDYAAPDRLLGLPPRSLGSFKQYPAYDRAGLVDLVRALTAFRASRFAAANAGTVGQPLHISMQTRARPTPALPGGPDLPVLVRPSAAGRLPSADGLRDLRDTLPLLPDTFRGTGATSVRLTGGAHLSAAFAFGAALPATLVGSLTVEGTDGVPWACGTVSATSDGLVHRVSHGMNPIKATGKPRDVIAFVDLLPDTSATAYARFLDEHADADAWEYLRPASAGRLDAATSGPLVEDVAARLRSQAQTHDNATLHLLLRCPFPVAVLLGRLCNTLRTVVYEWDDEVLAGDADHRARYIPAVVVQAGHASGPITDVLLPAPPTPARTAP
jgi:hypothetical protein